MLNQYWGSNRVYHTRRRSNMKLPACAKPLRLLSGKRGLENALGPRHRQECERLGQGFERLGWRIACSRAPAACPRLTTVAHPWKAFRRQGFSLTAHRHGIREWVAGPAAPWPARSGDRPDWVTTSRAEKRGSAAPQSAGKTELPGFRPPSRAIQGSCYAVAPPEPAFQQRWRLQREQPALHRHWIVVGAGVCSQVEAAARPPRLGSAAANTARFPCGPGSRRRRTSGKAPGFHKQRWHR